MGTLGDLFSWDEWTSNGTSWETSLDDAEGQARAWIDQVAKSKGWSSNDKADAYSLVDEARQAAESSWSFDTLTVLFWKELLSMWGDVDGPSGWDSLGDTFASASGSSYDPLTATVDNAEQFVQDVSGDVKAIVDPTSSPWPWVALGVVGLLVWRQFR